uniref:Uncharacterized protein n=1 Tax=Ditylenchus dipsaci TaxID=166011 RepID=A0A915EP27_9BILA
MERVDFNQRDNDRKKEALENERQKDSENHQENLRSIDFQYQVQSDTHADNGKRLAIEERDGIRKDVIRMKEITQRMEDRQLQHREVLNQQNNMHEDRKLEHEEVLDGSKVQ